jgi:hypothetical protein
MRGDFGCAGDRELHHFGGRRLVLEAELAQARAHVLHVQVAINLAGERGVGVP